MKREINPVSRFTGTLVLPGDKSIAHRAAILSIIAAGEIRVRNFPKGADCRSSLEAARSCGVMVSAEDDCLVLTPPASLNLGEDTIIDCGNSGTTARLIAGLIAGTDQTLMLAGDESLSKRPMKRIVDPLTAMGAELFDTDGHLPLRVRGKKLLPFEYRMPVASAQVKSALLLAGVASNCSVTVQEEIITRDHTEIMLRELGRGLSVRLINPVAVSDPNDPRKKRMQRPEEYKKEIKLTPPVSVLGGTIDIPADFSTAAFFMAGAAIMGSTVLFKDLGLNSTRTAFLDYLKQVGCEVTVADRRVISGEARGTVSVTGGELKARRISGEQTAAMIDEIPALAVVASCGEGTTIIRNAGELRVKESDRLVAIAENLSAMGVKTGILDDGLAIEGVNELNGADLKSFGDHRIAMAFSVAALAAVGPSSLDDDSSISVSCPEFWDLISGLTE